MQIDTTIIQQKIDSAIEQGQGESDASWGSQEGVLLSISEAKALLDYTEIQSRTITRLERQNRELQQVCDAYRQNGKKCINYKNLERAIGEIMLGGFDGPDIKISDCGDLLDDIINTIHKNK